MRHVLVTGAAGFIGSHLCDALLDAGHAVVGVDAFSPHYDRALKELNLTAARSREEFSFLEADLTDPVLHDAVADADAVFHLAARPGVRDSWQDFGDYVHANIAGTKAVLDACAGRDLRLVYSSSSSVYGDAERLPVDESQPLRPVSPYGATKVMTETLAHAYAASHRLPVVGLRYFTVYGPRQRPDMGISRFIEWAHSGREIAVYGDGHQLRDYTYVADATAATLLAAERGTPGRTYNVASGRPLELLEVLRTLDELVDDRLSLRHEDPKRGDVRDTHASIRLAAEELGYAPATALRDGLA
ncbi:MAG: NAD-dependent epimerase/dehydratase family protein, partial [Gemmatimonadales bacterium]